LQANINMSDNSLLITRAIKALRDIYTRDAKPEIGGSYINKRDILKAVDLLIL
jgi:hypothetical protein